MSTTKNPQPQPRILLAREVCALVRCHRVTLWRWVAADIFPSPRQFGPQRLCWLAGEVEDWMASRQAGIHQARGGGVKQRSAKRQPAQVEI